MAVASGESIGIELPPRLAAIVVKGGVSLGLLDATDRELVLALAATALPPALSVSEAKINERLKAWIAGSGAMLRIDHVELRRWLVDTRFLERDGFGHAYARAAASVARIEGLLGSDSALALDAAVAAARSARAARREAQRQAHTAR